MYKLLKKKGHPYYGLTSGDRWDKLEKNGRVVKFVVIITGV